MGEKENSLSVGTETTMSLRTKRNEKRVDLYVGIHVIKSKQVYIHLSMSNIKTQTEKNELHTFSLSRSNDTYRHK